MSGRIESRLAELAIDLQRRWRTSCLACSQVRSSSCRDSANEVRVGPGALFAGPQQLAEQMFCAAASFPASQPQTWPLTVN